MSGQVRMRLVQVAGYGLSGKRTVTHLYCGHTIDGWQGSYGSVQPCPECPPFLPDDAPLDCVLCGTPCQGDHS